MSDHCERVRGLLTEAQDRHSPEEPGLRAHVVHLFIAERPCLQLRFDRAFAGQSDLLGLEDLLQEGVDDDAVALRIQRHRHRFALAHAVVDGTGDVRKARRGLPFVALATGRMNVHQRLAAIELNEVTTTLVFFILLAHPACIDGHDDLL